MLSIYGESPLMTEFIKAFQHKFRKLPILGYPLLDGRQSAPV